MVLAEMITGDNDQWKGTLYFDLKIHNIYFNTKGKYLIKLRIAGSRGDLTKIKLSINGLKQSIYEHEYTSEPCYQEDPEVPCQLDDTQFRFEMPEEFSEGEVNLMVEAYQFPGNPLAEPFKCGKGMFLIFPSSSPTQTEPSCSADKEIGYHYNTQLLLNKIFTEEQLHVNIGQVHISVLLEMQEKQENVRKASISSKRTLQDLPLPSTSHAPPAHHLCGSVLTNDGNYEIVIQVHSACDLPSNALGRPPQPYVTGKATGEEQSGSQCATHATPHPTYSPLWEELLVIQVAKEIIQTQELVLSVFDDLSKSLITKFKLPLNSLRCFYPYHLELEQVLTDVKAKLYVTLMLKADEINLPSLHSEIFGLEVVLRNFSSRLAVNCTEPLVAVVRIVSDFTQYHQTYLSSKPNRAGIRTKKIKCPSSTSGSELATMVDADQYNVAQITLTGVPSEQPNWNQMVFFHGGQQALFYPSSALVIEYFRASQVVSFGRWQPTSPIGYCVHNLDNEMLTALRRDNATMGLRVENIEIKDSPLKNTIGEPASTNIILRLVTKKRPDPMISPSHYSILPVVHMTVSKFNPNISNISEAGTRGVNEHFPSSFPLATVNQKRSNPMTEQQNVNKELNPSVYSIMERQTKEIEKHRYAMKKMADDIIQLKSEATRLQAANNRLRIELQHRHESNYMSSLPSHLENTTHAELVQRIVIVKGSLDEQIAINRELKLEIQSLHNQMIKKNEKEKELYKLQDAHKNQQILLQKMQERLRRTKTLEETCKKQEKVIIRLEECLTNPKTKKKGQRDEDDLAENGEEDFPDENRRLRAQLLNYERTNKAVNDMDRLQVHDKLHRAEARVAALEKELMENTRKWARDKAELQLKLSETQMTQSFGHWSGYNQDSLGLFDMTPPDSRHFHTNHSKRGSPKLSPLTKK